MKLDPSQHSEADNYKLLTNLVVPRPIAWVTSINELNIVNLAPFSFFNAVSSDPLLVIISVGTRDNNSQKDTARNIIRSGEFAINMVTEDLMQAMNISAVDFPPNISEVEASGLQVVVSEKIKVPRLAQSPINMECKLHTKVDLGVNTLFVSEIVMFHVADDLISERLRINGFAPIGRLGSPSAYCRTADRFELPRMSYQEYLAQLDDSHA